MIYIFLLIIILLVIAAFAVNEGFNQQTETGPIKKVNIITGGTQYKAGKTGYFLDDNNGQRGGRFKVTKTNLGPDYGVSDLEITYGGNGYAVGDELSLAHDDSNWNGNRGRAEVTKIETLNNSKIDAEIIPSVPSTNSNCNFIPLGETLTKCKENCRKYRELHDENNNQYSQCNEDICDKKCAECNNDENCLWVKNNMSKILNNKEIIIETAKFNKLKKTITLKWKVKSIPIQKIKDLLRYDNKETKIQKILHMKNMIRQETPCATGYECNNSTDLMNNINKYLDETDQISISKDNEPKIELEEHPYLCKKNTINDDNFYIFVSSNIDREDTDLIIKTGNLSYDKNNDDKDYRYTFCVSDNKDRDCKQGDITLNRGLQYIFYISSPNKELTSNIKVVST